jgi:predicted alpha/beta hydrolase family esterase
MSVAAWSAQIAEALGDLGADDRVVAHSFGASVLLLMLADGLELPGEVRMLAMPNWGPDGWDVAEYAFAGSEPSTPLVLQHCRDDEVVPFDHLALNAALLPSARVVVRDRGGHQFGF